MGDKRGGINMKTPDGTLNLSLRILTIFLVAIASLAFLPVAFGVALKEALWMRKS
jgi:hypothetical protein